MSDDRMDMLPIFTVDAFTKEQFKGNPAAVCLIPHNKDVSKGTKQKIAAEMNLSETAFISILEEKDTFENGKRFGLQWFTPKCEVPLCGHATLASATVLFSACCNDSPILEFETVSGTLTAKKMPDGKIELDLPAYNSKPVDMKKYEHIIKAALGSLSAAQEVVLSESGKLLVRFRDDVTRCKHQLRCGFSKDDSYIFNCATTVGSLSAMKEVFLSDSSDLLIRLRNDATRSELEALKPDQAELLSEPDLNGLIVTLKADDGEHDFVSRYFAPWLGVYEDPVTGAAHCVLAPYWSKVLGKTKLFARQCSPRGGELSLNLKGDRVGISGHSVLVLQGQINF